MKAVDELLCGVQSSEDETECVEEVEILMEDEVEKVERGKEEKEISHEALSDMESAKHVHNDERALDLEGECKNQEALSGPKQNICDSILMGEVKNEMVKNCHYQTTGPPIKHVANQLHQISNMAHPPNSTGHVISKMEQASLKPHRCDSCGKGFVSRSNMRAHMRLHEGTALRYGVLPDKQVYICIYSRYKCPHCEKKFSHPSEVKQHQVVHTG